FKDLIEASAQATGVAPYGDENVHHRVIADHLRSTSFLIADGVLPSNEGRGYVLRRIMRRAMRHAHLLGAKDPVMHRLVPALVAQMGQAYHELSIGQSMIEETLLLEETLFKTTLERCLKLLDDEVNKSKQTLEAESGTYKILPGDVAFKLYDTFGFPLDLTQDALREKGMEVDTDGFETAMAEQKAKARAAWAGTGQAADESIWFDVAEEYGLTEFLGYDTEFAEGKVVAVVANGALVENADKGADVEVVLNQTPFYAESGGQIGDSGVLKTDNATVQITDVKKKAGVFVHIGTVSEGRLLTGAAAELVVNNAKRSAVRHSHSATHLLNEALRETLGTQVAQRGSLNAADRLRFDFSHAKAMTDHELAKVEMDVNDYIRQNTRVETRIMTPDEARDLGAQALFGEKYGDEVRVVSMGMLDGSGKGLDQSTYSLELCGGTHVGQLGEIGLFALLGESASASGVRRIEALTGTEALSHLKGQSSTLADIAGTLKAKPEHVAIRVQALLDERKALQNEVAELRRAVAMGGRGQSADAEDIAGVPFFAQVLNDVPGKDLRGLIDEHKNRLGSAVILLISDAGGKAAVAAGVTDDLTDKISAVDIVKVAATVLGGKGGGGRADMAQAGGADAANAKQAVEAARNLLGEK
ncbi:MAG: alanine--tRNA ligase, partial [Amylibacter sp.]